MLVLALAMSAHAGWIANFDQGQPVGGCVGTPGVPTAIVVAGYADHPDSELVVGVRVEGRIGAIWDRVSPLPIAPDPLDIREKDGQDHYGFSTTIDLSPWWEPGALVTIRVTDQRTGTALHVLDEASCADSRVETPLSACIDEMSPALTLADACTAPNPNPDGAPAANIDGSAHLYWRQNTVAQAEAYYATTNAPDTYSEWLDRNGFRREGLATPLSLAARYGPEYMVDDVVRAVYFNYNDLGLGRDTRCREVAANDPGEPCEHTDDDTVVRLACAVANFQFASFSSDGDPSMPFIDDEMRGTILEEAGRGQGAGFVVVMEHVAAEPSPADCGGDLPPPASDPVRFAAYQIRNDGSDLPEGEDRTLETIQLDRYGQQAIPGMCLNCHGGDVVTDRDGDVNVVGARFLPFDAGMYGYHEDPLLYTYGGDDGETPFAVTDGPVTLDNQRDAFRELNRMVRDTVAPSEPIAGMVDLWYPDGFDAPDADGAFESTPPGWEDEPELYHEVVRPYCRVCHMAFEDTWSPLGGTVDTFDTVDAFLGLPGVLQRTCGGNQDMPHAATAQDRFWRSPGRQILVDLHDSLDRCGPASEVDDWWW